MESGANRADPEGVEQGADRQGSPTDSAPEDQKTGEVQEQERKALHPLDLVWRFARRLRTGNQRVAFSIRMFRVPGRPFRYELTVEP
jgi:hypothetical protein